MISTSYEHWKWEAAKRLFASGVCLSGSIVFGILVLDMPICGLLALLGLFCAGESFAEAYEIIRKRGIDCVLAKD